MELDKVVDTTWAEGMAFETHVSGHRFFVDAHSQFGGQDKGPRPKELLLSALGGCTGMDVVSMLTKMQQPLSFFNVKVKAHMTDEHPKYYDTIVIEYQFKKSDGLDPSKVEKAVNLSQERYCGVSTMLSKAAKLDYEIVYLD